MLGLIILASAAQSASFAPKFGLAIAQLALLPAATLGDSVAVGADGSTIETVGSTVRMKKTKKPWGNEEVWAKTDKYVGKYDKRSSGSCAGQYETIGQYCKRLSRIRKQIWKLER